MLRTLALSLFALAASAASAQSAWTSDIVYPGDSGGRLVYVQDSEGNRVPDFSRAGYGGGGVPLPAVPTVATVSPGEGDDTAAIQSALDAVSGRQPDANGIRGAVDLAAGTYQVEGTLTIRESGVVLRGAGDDADASANTILQRGTGNGAPVIVVGRSEASQGDALIRRDSARPAAIIADEVVEIGAASFSVDTPERYALGDEIVVFHPSTVDWINSVDGGGTASDDRWAVGSMSIGYARTITGLEGNTITLDAPVFARLVRSVARSYIYLRNRSNVIEQVGVESLRIDIETSSASDESQAKNAIELSLVEHGWVDGVTALHFWHAGVSVQNSRYVTVRNSRALEPHSLIEGERRYNFEVDQSQLVLFEGNEASFARHAYVGNGQQLDSGIVFLGNTSTDAFTSSEAHRRWGQGFLYDNHVEIGSRGSGTSDRRIHLGNRGDFGTGHGWACANCVVWNAQMNGALVIVEKPPTAQNYAIGVQGTVSSIGPFLANTQPYIEGTNRTGLDPQSLYLRQIRDRQTPVAGDGAPTGGLHLGSPSPNPTSGTTSISFELAAPTDVSLSVVDVLGREVTRLADGPRAAGSHRQSFDAGRLAPGVYLARLTTGTAVRAVRFTVVR